MSEQASRPCQFPGCRSGKPCKPGYRFCWQHLPAAIYQVRREHQIPREELPLGRNRGEGG